MLCKEYRHYMQSQSSSLILPSTPSYTNTILSQVYANVDALIKAKLMVFFELRDLVEQD